MFTPSFIIDTITVLGTAAFALSAVLAAHEKHGDIFTILVLGTITAVGGGTIRDTLLDVPVFWAQELSYVYIACFSAAVGFFFYPLLNAKWINKIYLYIDAFAIAMFSIQGTEKAFSLGFGLPVGPIILGVITAVGGGIIRDVLLQRPSLLLTKELYAIPVALGCTVHALTLTYAPSFSEVSAILASCLVIYLRHLSIQSNLMVPNWAILKSN
ncbi:trimeric intracellular cation channel family protein [Vibrio agarivorans]|uniref:trimeric intracellular cation channel family protein n=1 Tax=Vibrio agarivorans TaxID=153622 RepID=UPI0022301E39|nr:trimeric intracellular cation channel family protein [Vibrio agarivorans]MDN3660580.1 trimeric intracellular cation channel family protein [Vibrio agarivorans]